MIDFAGRRGRVRERLSAVAPAFLVTAPANVRYLTGFTGSNGQVLIADDPAFFTDGRYTEQSEAEVVGVERFIYSGATKFGDLVSKRLVDNGTRKLAVEGSHVTIDGMERFRSSLDGIEIVPCSELVEKVRLRKDAGEIEAIRRAQRVAETALVESLKSLNDGTENALALQIEWAMRTGGAEAVSFEVIVAGGAHSALPHATPRPVALDVDGVVLIDMGAKVDGYCSDMTRTYLGPQAPEALRHVHRAVCDALEAACAAVRPGVPAKDVDAAARDVLADAGYGELFVHSTGHGVGLDVHEGPSLGMASEDVLEAGMVVTIEPGVYMPGVGGVRVEDLLVVTESGSDNLTALDRGADRPG